MTIQTKNWNRGKLCPSIEHIQSHTQYFPRETADDSPRKRIFMRPRYYPFPILIIPGYKVYSLL